MSSSDKQDKVNEYGWFLRGKCRQMSGPVALPLLSNMDQPRACTEVLRGFLKAAWRRLADIDL